MICFLFVCVLLCLRDVVSYSFVLIIYVNIFLKIHYQPRSYLRCLVAILCCYFSCYDGPAHRFRSRLVLLHT